MKMKLKKTILLALSLIMALGTMGCGTKNEDEAATSDTWQTASIGYEVDGEMQPEYYVQFSDSEIVYGHMENNEFVPEYSDSISSYEETAEGGYKIQAESESGVQYTYQSAEGDVDILEYYSTWNEDEYADNYSGSSSLSRVE